MSNNDYGHVHALTSISKLDPVDRLWSYWNGLRTSGPIPLRQSVRPAALGAILEYAFIAESCVHNGAKFRVVGGHVNALKGMDMRGMPVTALIAPEKRNDFAQALRQVFDTPATLEFQASSKAFYSGGALNAECLILPLADQEGASTRALGVWATFNNIGETPRFFDSINNVCIDPLRRNRSQRFKQHSINETKKAAHQSERPYLKLVQ